MIRVFYQHPRPEADGVGYYDAEHSQPVADMAQFELRKRAPCGSGYGLAGVKVTRIEQIDTSYENAAADYYAKYGTAGEF